MASARLFPDRQGIASLLLEFWTTAAKLLYLCQVSSDQRLILPDTIGPLMSGYTTTAILTASVELDVFTAISRGSQTATSIASACRSTERGMKALLDALVGIRLLIKRDDKFADIDWELKTIIPV